MIPIKLRRIDHLLQIRPSLNQLLKYSNARNADLFGVEEVSSKDVGGTIEREIQPDDFNKKYSFIASNLKRTDNEEKILSFPHGYIRFDKDNQPKYHGQYDEDNEKLKYDSNSIDHLIDDIEIKSKIKDQNFQNKESNSDQIKNPIQGDEASLTENSTATIFQRKSMDSNQPNQIRNEKPFRQKVDISNVNIYDFEPIKKDYSTTKLKFNKNLFHNQTEFKFAQQWSDWIDRDINQLRHSPLALVLGQQKLVLNSSQTLKSKYEDVQAGKLNEEEDSYSPLKSIDEIDMELSELKQEEPDDVKSESMDLESIFKDDPLKKPKKDVKEDEEIEFTEEEEEFRTQKSENVEEVTSLEYIRMIKDNEVTVGNKDLNKILKSKAEESTKDKLEYDSKGFRNYKNHVFSLYKLNVLERALFLESETIFNGLGIVAVNKPYGLICLNDNPANKKSGVKFDTFIKDFTYLIATKDREDKVENTFDDLNNPVLYPIYKLDQNCTGVYILAKNKEVAKRLHDMFLNKNASFFYQAITKNIPKLEKATIDIPIEKNHNDVKHRMALKPVVPDEYKMYVKPSKFADKAVTNYKVLKSNNMAAHLELNPQTSVRHQLRVHLGFGLRTPILGDHLYDNPSKVTYQKLPLSILTKLNVRATKTMHIPLHLHCKMIILSQFRSDGRDFSLRCDPPHFFKESLKSLKLN